MAELRNLKKSLQSIKDRIAALGSSNRNRWASITMEQTITFDKFYEKVKFLGSNATEAEVQCMWYSIGISNPMKYTDFLKFVQFDVDDLVIKEPPSNQQQRSTSQNDDLDSKSEEKNEFEERLSKSRSNPQRNSFRNEFEERLSLGENRLKDDYENRYQPDLRRPREVGSIADQIRSNLSNVVMSCLSSDPQQTGEVPQRIFGEICRRIGITVNHPDFLHLMQQNDASGRGTVSYFLVCDQACHSNLYLQNRPTFQPISLPEEPTFRKFEEELPVRRSNPLFPEKSIEKVEPKIIEEEVGPNEKSEFPDAKMVSPSSLQELSKMIANQINSCIGNTKSAFMKWKGQDSFLTATDLRAGLARDTRMLFPRNMIYKLCESYGGDLNLTSFVRLIQGNSDNQSQPKRSSEDAYIQLIAKQSLNKKWEDVIFKSSCSDDIAKGFQKLGIEVDEVLIRKLSGKLGKTGLIDAIKSKL